MLIVKINREDVIAEDVLAIVGDLVSVSAVKDFDYSAERTSLTITISLGNGNEYTVRIPIENLLIEGGEDLESLNLNRFVKRFVVAHKKSRHAEAPESFDLFDYTNYI